MNIATLGSAMITLMAWFCCISYSHAQGVYFKAKNADCMVWNEAPQPNEVVVIQGVCEGGYINGPAIVRWYEGEKLTQTIEGFYKNGLVNGDTRITGLKWSYVGQILNNKFNGRGHLWSGNGYYYIGDFLNDKPHGFGESMAPNGIKYVGYWRDGKFHGEGMMYKANGEFAGIGIFEFGKFVRLHDVYDRISSQRSIITESHASNFSPPKFYENPNEYVAKFPSTSQQRTVNIVMPDGSVSTGIMWSTGRSGAFNSGVFLQILR